MVVVVGGGGEGRGEYGREGGLTNERPQTNHACGLRANERPQKNRLGGGHIQIHIYPQTSHLLDRIGENHHNIFHDQNFSNKS